MAGVMAIDNVVLKFRAKGIDPMLIVMNEARESLVRQLALHIVRDMACPLTGLRLGVADSRDDFI